MCQVGIVEGGKNTLRSHSALCHRLKNRLLKSRPLSHILKLKVNSSAMPGSQIQRLVQSGNPLSRKRSIEPAPGIQQKQFLISIIGNRPLRTRDPAQTVIMKYHRLSVSGHLHIQLDIVRTDIKGTLKGSKRIFRELRGVAPVGNDSRKKDIRLIFTRWSFTFRRFLYRLLRLGFLRLCRLLHSIGGFGRLSRRMYSAGLPSGKYKNRQYPAGRKQYPGFIPLPPGKKEGIACHDKNRKTEGSKKSRILCLHHKAQRRRQYLLEKQNTHTSHEKAHYFLRPGSLVLKGDKTSLQNPSNPESHSRPGVGKASCPQHGKETDPAACRRKNKIPVSAALYPGQKLLDKKNQNSASRQRRQNILGRMHAQKIPGKGNQGKYQKARSRKKPLLPLKAKGSKSSPHRRRSLGMAAWKGITSRPGKRL